MTAHPLEFPCMALVGTFGSAHFAHPPSRGKSCMGSSSRPLACPLSLVRLVDQGSKTSSLLRLGFFWSGTGETPSSSSPHHPGNSLSSINIHQTARNEVNADVYRINSTPDRPRGTESENPERRDVVESAPRAGSEAPDLRGDSTPSSAPHSSCPEGPSRPIRTHHDPSGPTIHHRE